MTLNLVWVVTATDDDYHKYGPLVFSYKPTDKELKGIAHYWSGSVDNEDAIHLSVDCCGLI